MSMPYDTDPYESDWGYGNCIRCGKRVVWALRASVEIRGDTPPGPTARWIEWVEEDRMRGPFCRPCAAKESK